MTEKKPRLLPPQERPAHDQIRLSPRAARILLPLGAIAVGGASLLSRAARPPVSSDDRGLGLAATPSYVPDWKRPRSVTAGKADGSIPQDALPFETGNSGRAFSDLTAWIEACNAQDVPGAIETAQTAESLPRSYIARGLYGAGPRNVKIRWLRREKGVHHCWLHVRSNDVVIRGIDFEGFNLVVGLTYPTLPLKSDDGQIDHEPYHSSSEVVYRALKASQDGAAKEHWCQRIGRIRFAQPLDVRSVRVKRQVGVNTFKAGEKTRGYFDDLAWNAVLEEVTLTSGRACRTEKELVAAINATSGSTGYRARVNAPGEVFLLARDSNTPAVVQIVVDGEGAISCDVQSPAVDISHCTFTDTNLAFGAILDVSELGPVKFCKNDMPGTWGGVGAFVTRWSEVYFANNHWRNCSPERPTAIGRTSSCLPAGSNMTAFNTACYMGTNSSVMMRYHASGNTALVENNKVDDIVSLNKSDTVNCAVLADIRNGWQVSSANKKIRFAYNDVSKCRGAPGSQDCNIIYGKLRGFSVLGNRFSDFGTQALELQGKRIASEGLALLFKNPGPYNQPINGAYSEPAIIMRNRFIDGAGGVAWIKLDEMLATVVIEQNLFRGWKRDGSPIDGRSSGLVRLTSHQKAVCVQSNRFENIALQDLIVWPLISLWNLKLSDPAADFGNFTIANNEIVSARSDTSDPAAATSIAMVSLSSPSDSAVAAISKVVTGHNTLLDPNNRVLRSGLSIRYNKASEVIEGTQSAASNPYQTG